MLFITIVGLNHVIKAQQIVSVEYFIDVDPGIGNATPLSISPADTVDLDIDIPINSLPKGMHTLFVRVKFDNNIWSILNFRSFWIIEKEKPDTTIRYVQFYFDNKVDNAVSIAIQGDKDTVVDEYVKSLDVQTPGFHNLCTVVKGEKYTSIPYISNIYVKPIDTLAKIVGARYFIDTIPDIKAGTELTSFSPVDTLNDTLETQPIGLSAGQHKIYVVVTDNVGRKSHFQKASFNLCDVLPVANFTANVNVYDTTVLFTNTSTNYDGTTVFEWDFDGDGTNDYTGSSKLHKYNAFNTYNVRLIASNSSVCRDTIIKKVAVDIDTCKIKAGFTFAIDNVNKSVSFTNTSTGNIASYYWDFGDGTTSTQIHPIKTYSKTGYYTVSLSVKKIGSNCSDVYSTIITVGSTSCKAIFSYTVNGNTVQFNNQSLGIDLRYFWYFDDGTYSTEESPTHEFGQSGEYKVSLSVSTPDNECSNEMIVPIKVGSLKCNANFSYYVEQGTLTITLNAPINNLDAQYYWTLSDGSQSSESSFSHTFKRAGVYSIRLSVFDSQTNCYEEFKKEITVGQISNICDADFTYQANSLNNEVKFFDKSKGDIIGYLWNFGDGEIVAGVTQVNPTHTYTTPGYYNVCQLIVSANKLFDMKCQPVVAKVDNPGNCYAEFSYVMDPGTKSVKFLDKSKGTPNKWEWNFGNGKTSTSQNPSTSYSSSGYYLVKLKITDETNNCQSVNFGTVNINMPQKLKGNFGYVQRTKKSKAGGYPIDLIGAGLGDQAKLKWSFGDGSSDTTTTTPTHEYGELGTYNVCYSLYDQLYEDVDTICQDVVVQNTGIGIAEGKLGYLNVFPNPMGNKIRIEYATYDDTKLDINIISIDGRVNESIVSKHVTKGNYILEWNTESYSAGAYVVTMRVDNVLVNYKILFKK